MEYRLYRDVLAKLQTAETTVLFEFLDGKTISGRIVHMVFDAAQPVYDEIQLDGGRSLLMGYVTRLWTPAWTNVELRTATLIENHMVAQRVTGTAYNGVLDREVPTVH